MKEYIPGKGCPGMNCILWNECSALACKGHGLIDWGAISCIVENAGGIVSAWDGSKIPTAHELDSLKFDSILMAADTETHERLLRLLQS